MASGNHAHPDPVRKVGKVGQVQVEPCTTFPPPPKPSGSGAGFSFCSHLEDKEREYKLLRAQPIRGRVKIGKRDTRSRAGHRIKKDPVHPLQMPVAPKNPLLNGWVLHKLTGRPASYPAPEGVTPLNPLIQPSDFCPPPIVDFPVDKLGPVRDICVVAPLWEGPKIVLSPAAEASPVSQGEPSTENHPGYLTIPSGSPGSSRS